MQTEFHNLVGVADDDRDLEWEKQFLSLLPQANVELMSQDPQTGPDGWPYLMVATNTEGTEPISKIIDWLSVRGMGLVINPHKDYPDYVLSYGMVWFYRKTGKFMEFDISKYPATEQENFNQASFKLSGTPSQDFLPDFVRKILKEFFLDQGILQPRISMLSQDGTNFDLAFSLESLSNPPAEELAGIAEAIGWFLPSHYRILLISEAGLPKFIELS